MILKLPTGILAHGHPPSLWFLGHIRAKQPQRIHSEDHIAAVMWPDILILDCKYWPNSFGTALCNDIRGFPVLPGFIDEGQRHDMIFGIVSPKTHMHWTSTKSELGSFNRAE